MKKYIRYLCNLIKKLMNSNFFMFITIIILFGLPDRSEIVV